MNLLCIDPGTYESGWVALNTKLGIKGAPVGHGIDRNDAFADFLKKSQQIDHVACEKLDNYGSASRSLYDTAEWFGEFRRICKDKNIPFTEIMRLDVKMALCGTASGVKDLHIKEQCAYHWGVPLIKGKLSGVLKGIVSHEISALAIGLTYMKTFGVK